MVEVMKKMKMNSIHYGGVLVSEWFPTWRNSHNIQEGPRQTYTTAQFAQYARQRWSSLSEDKKDYYRELAKTQ